MRRRGFLALLAGWALTRCALPVARPRETGVPRQRGVGLDPFPAPFTPDDFRRLADLGVEWVALFPYGYMEGHRDPVVHRFTGAELEPALRDEAFLALARMARRAGLRLFVQPHLQDFRDGHWRGEVEMDSEEDWAAWFESYRAFAIHYARLAARAGAEGFSMGAELRRTVIREAEWRETVRLIRLEFGGWLTYGANWWREVAEVPWWDALDAIGVQAYYELGPDDSAAGLRAAWIPIHNRLAAVADRTGRPVLFTEIGYKSQAGATEEPWRWEITGPRDDALQARAYEAVFETFWDAPWFRGVYWWKWQARAASPADRERDFTPQGKPAERVMARWYGDAKSR